MKRWLVFPALMVILFAGICIVENRAIQCRPASPQENTASSIYMLAGEFRTVFANLLWIKTDNYQHEFAQRHGSWTQNKEVMGLLDLIIMLDPRFEEAYACQAYIYIDAYHNPRKAFKTLLAGIAHNPESRELNELAAVVCTLRLQDPARAIRYAQRAVELAEDDFYLRRTTRLLGTVQRLAAEKATARPGQ